MHRRLLVAAALVVFLAGSYSAGAQNAPRQGWMASGTYVGVRGQYRRFETTEYTTGFDALPMYVVKTGNRYDTPVIGPTLGYGLGLGFVQCEGPRALAFVMKADYSLATGSGSSAAGSLDYASHEVDLAVEGLYPLGRGLALSVQIGWNLDFFFIADGFAPGGTGPRTDVLLSSLVGLDIGGGLAYVIDRRLLIEAKAVYRFVGYNFGSGTGVFDGLGTEIGRAETALELTAGWIF